MGYKQVSLCFERGRKDKAYLSSALDNIEGANSSVGKTAGEDAANHAFSVVGRVVHVTHFISFG